MLTNILLIRPVIRIIMRLHIAIYRNTKGKIFGSVQGRRVVLLTTTGRNTGMFHTVPLGAAKEGKNYIVVASNGGRDYHPSWFLNILCQSEAILEVGEEVMTVRAVQIHGSESERLGVLLPWLERYTKRTIRQIPVVLLEKVL